MKSKAPDCAVSAQITSSSSLFSRHQKRSDFRLIELFKVCKYCGSFIIVRSPCRAGDKLNWEMEERVLAVWHGGVKSASNSLRLVTYTISYQSLPSAQPFRGADKVKMNKHRGVMKHFLYTGNSSVLSCFLVTRHDRGKRVLQIVFYL